MQCLFLIATLLVAAFSLWWVFYGSISRWLLFRKSGLAYFKILLRHRGVDLGRIPDAALIEIIKVKIAHTRGRSQDGGVDPQRREPRNWRLQLVRALEAEADIIASLMAEGSERQLSSDATCALSKHGVFETDRAERRPAFTPEQFAEATQRGTLYAELSARLSALKSS